MPQMNRFAFVLHPLKARHIARKYPYLAWIPDQGIEAILRRMKPKILSEITGIETPQGAKTEGIFILCPYTPRQFVSLPVGEVTSRIIECADIAHREGCQIIGLGAFTSVVGDGGVTVAEHSKIPVTTGNSYTVATAIDGALEACRLVGVDTRSSTLAVVGATGSIGRTCSEILSPLFQSTILVGRDKGRIEELAQSIPGAIATTDIASIKQADLVVTVTSSDVALIEPSHIKPGAVVCDVARPRDVSVRVAKSRPDVLVIEGGVVSVPGENLEFGLDFGFPPKTAYACMSETMMLALEEEPYSLTLGKTVTIDQVEITRKLAEKHGFKIAGFRSFEKAVDQEAIDRVRQVRLGGRGLVESHG